jgi:hypothetical protein
VGNIELHLRRNFQECSTIVVSALLCDPSYLLGDDELTDESGIKAKREAGDAAA